MPHHDERQASDDLTHLRIEHGPAAMASALATLVNHAMQIEREQARIGPMRGRGGCGDRDGPLNGVSAPIG